MEIEKPFKCSTCNARFTNEDHLCVHKRRHEMSLNLKAGLPHPNQQNIDSFVDETPTPTRFFRTCEEVGLFQDLQNVNPFDEQFAKAGGGGGSTPSSSTTGVDQFDFSIAIPSGAVVGNNNPSSGSTDYLSSSSTTSKRRYSDQDTLNTPQVFGYLISTNTPTCTNYSSTTTTVLNPVPVEGGAGGDLNLRRDSVKGDNQKDSHTNSATGTKLFSSHGGGGSGGLRKNQKQKKTALKLNLSPITPNIFMDGNDSSDSNPNTSRSLGERRQNVKGIPILEEKKAELLERNRAAASRSRQRRKQWLSNLESRCETLEKNLARTKAELMREQADNQMLRVELSKHVNCDVTKSQNGSFEVQTQGIQIVLVKPKSTQPNILRQMSQPSIIKTVSNVIQTGDTVPIESVLPKSKIPAKRGRPRKGEERRLQGINFSTTPSTSTGAKLPLFPLWVSSTVGRVPDE